MNNEKMVIIFLIQLEFGSDYKLNLFCEKFLFSDYKKQFLSQNKSLFEKLKLILFIFFFEFLNLVF